MNTHQECAAPVDAAYATETSLMPLQGELEISLPGKKFLLRPGQQVELKGIPLHFSFTLQTDCWMKGLAVRVEEIAGLHAAARPGLRTVPLELKHGSFEVKTDGSLSLLAPADIQVRLQPQSGTASARLWLRIAGETGEKLRRCLGAWLEKSEPVQISGSDALI